MCYAYGSPDHATGVCPMCKVFKPSARCPHIKEVCHNRMLHPRHDVVYLKNAEVTTFSGCGFCKWANTNPSPKSSGYQNPGWPGCCRPPSANDQKLIGAADWFAVSAVHHIPIPPEIKAILDSLAVTTKSISTHAGTTGSTRSPSSQSPIMARRATSIVVGPTRTDTTPTRTPPMTIPIKGRSGGSPPQLAVSLTNSISRNPNGDGTASSLPIKSNLDQIQSQRRPTAETHGDKRSETSQHSPGRKQAELGVLTSRRNPERVPAISAAVPSMSLSKVTIDVQPGRTRSLTTTANPPMTSTRAADRQTTAPASLAGRRTSVVDESFATKSISGSSSSSGSNSETTVISDGGFTDYLSDESEAELQRQAEVKAAQLAQNHMEEQEFKAARQQLASVDLRPPKSWTGNVNTTPRSQTSSAPATSYTQPSSYSATYTSGHANVASSTASRG